MERRLLVESMVPLRDTPITPSRHRLFAPCPHTAELVATHVVETPARLSRLSGRFVFWCPHCRSAHAIEVEDGCVVNEGQTFGRAPSSPAAVVDLGGRMLARPARELATRGAVGLS